MDFESIMPNHLSYFATVYKCRSYPEAASMIPMTLPGVKKAIRKLEHDTGFELFTSDDAALVPTPYADELYAMVRSWYSDINELSRSLNRLHANECVSLSLGAALGIPGFLGIDFVHRFQKAHPSIAVQLTELGDYRVDGALADHEFDLALTVAPFSDAFETQVLYEEPITMWVNRRDPLSAREEIELSDLDGRVLGIIDRTCKTNATVAEALEEAGVRPAYVVTTSELFWLLRFALDNKGLGLGVDHVAKELFGPDTVVSIPVRGLYWRIGVSRLKCHQPTDAESLLIDFLREIVHERKAFYGTLGGVG